MDKVVEEYVAAYQTFYNLMEWAISNDFDDIFHDMIFVLHFIHDVESFHLHNPGKSFVKTMPIRLLPKIMERKSRFPPNAPECGTYIAQYLQNYAGDRCFGRQPDRHG